MILAFLLLASLAGATERDGRASQTTANAQFWADKTAVQAWTPTQTPTQTGTATPTVTPLPTLIACGSVHKVASFGPSWVNGTTCQGVASYGWQAGFAAKMAANGDSVMLVGSYTLPQTTSIVMDCPYTNGVGGSTSTDARAEILTAVPTMFATPQASDRIILFAISANDLGHGGNQASMTTAWQGAISDTARLTGGIPKIVMCRALQIYGVDMTPVWNAENAAFAWAQSLSYNIQYIDTYACIQPQNYCAPEGGHLPQVGGYDVLGGCMAAQIN